MLIKSVRKNEVSPDFKNLRGRERTELESQVNQFWYDSGIPSYAYSEALRNMFLKDEALNLAGVESEIENEIYSSGWARRAMGRSSGSRNPYWYLEAKFNSFAQRTRGVGEVIFIKSLVEEIELVLLRKLEEEKFKTPVYDYIMTDLKRFQKIRAEFDSALDAEHPQNNPLYLSLRSITQYSVQMTYAEILAKRSERAISRAKSRDDTKVGSSAIWYDGVFSPPAKSIFLFSSGVVYNVLRSYFPDFVPNLLEEHPFITNLVLFGGGILIPAYHRAVIALDYQRAGWFKKRMNQFLVSIGSPTFQPAYAFSDEKPVSFPVPGASNSDRIPVHGRENAGEYGEWATMTVSAYVEKLKLYEEHFQVTPQSAWYIGNVEIKQLKESVEELDDLLARDKKSLEQAMAIAKQFKERNSLNLDSKGNLIARLSSMVKKNDENRLVNYRGAFVEKLTNLELWMSEISQTIDEADGATGQFLSYRIAHDISPSVSNLQDYKLFNEAAFDGLREAVKTENSKLNGYIEKLKSLKANADPSSWSSLGRDIYNFLTKLEPR